MLAYTLAKFTSITVHICQQYGHLEQQQQLVFARWLSDILSYS